MNRMARAYIAGPMQGITDHNFPAFDACRNYLLCERVASEVVSPADLTRQTLNVTSGSEPLLRQMTAEQYARLMRADLAQVLASNLIVALNGWENSVGARVELFVALTCGIPVYLYKDENPVGQRVLTQVRMLEVKRALTHAFTEELKFADTFSNAVTGAVLASIQQQLTKKPARAPASKEPMSADVVLKLADELVSTDRQQDYGHPLDNFSTIARLWQVVIDRDPHAAELTADDVAMMLVLLKVARQLNKPTDDNIVDIAGYAKCAQLIITERTRRNDRATR